MVRKILNSVKFAREKIGLGNYDETLSTVKAKKCPCQETSKPLFIQIPHCILFSNKKSWKKDFLRNFSFEILLQFFQKLAKKNQIWTLFKTKNISSKRWNDLLLLTPSKSFGFKWFDLLKRRNFIFQSFLLDSQLASFWKTKVISLIRGAEMVPIEFFMEIIFWSFGTHTLQIFEKV